MASHRLIKNVSSDKGGLHFKMITDTSETYRYAKNVKRVTPQVLRHHLAKLMQKHIDLAAGQLRRAETRKHDKDKWVGDSGWGSESAGHKIADSLVVAETRDYSTPRSGVSVSAWSQDSERPSNFTSAGVRGSRARTGRRYEGKIAQYYEQGRAPHKISRDHSDGSRTQEFTHAGYPKLAYMAKARLRVINEWQEYIDNILQQNIGVGKTAVTTKPNINAAAHAQMKKGDYSSFR